jgi:hypothetical protein
LAPHHCATNLVFSYQNVTVILSSKTKCLHFIYARPPPTFLFLPYSIVKKQTDQNPSKIPQSPTLKSGNKTSKLPISRILSEPVRQASRRRLSFGEAAYTANPF